VSTSYSIVEGDPLGRVDVGVALSAPSSLPVTVSYATADVTAVADLDYTAASASGNLTFAPGETGQSFSVSVITDTTVESTETAQLSLSNPTSATLGITATATLFIIDDDPEVTAGTCPISTTQEALPNIGLPNGLVAGIQCGFDMIVPMAPKTIVADGDTAPDMVYYEYLQTSGGPAACPNSFIFLDWVVVQVGTSDTGPWYTVFHWGDNIPDTNTNVVSGTEQNNAVYCASSLYGGTSGVSINVDARAPAGVYTYVRLYVPVGPPPSSPPLDALELDALDALP
jgi:hypothetical protein